jgi:anti-sigma regulatory factor (Ser/Thr protein kinase)
VRGLRVSVNLPAIGSSAHEARQLVSETLAQRGHHDPALVDRVVLVTSELVTNAILHARTDVGLDMSVDGSSILLEVTDASPVPLPAPHVPDPDETSGRGLFLVDILADEWGVRTAGGGGKTVWIRVVTS